MRTRVVAIVFGAVTAALSGSAMGQGMPLPSDQTFCIRHDGSLYHPHCTRSGCDCGTDYHIIEPYCAVNEPSAPSTSESNRARYQAAAAGRLDNARFEGRRFCVSPPRPHSDFSSAGVYDYGGGTLVTGGVY